MRIVEKGLNDFWGQQMLPWGCHQFPLWHPGVGWALIQRWESLWEGFTSRIGMVVTSAQPGWRWGIPGKRNPITAGLSSFQGCTEEIPLRGSRSPGLSKVASRSQSISVPCAETSCLRQTSARQPCPASIWQEGDFSKFLLKPHHCLLPFPCSPISSHREEETGQSYLIKLALM